MFQTGKELDALFKVEAAFYKMEANGRAELCRSLATVRRRGREEETADALFVLSNPGKCLPKAAEALVSLSDGPLDSLPLLQANSDNTLYQLMRLMERMDWNFVKVINLSDLRAEKSTEFAEKARYMKTHGNSLHSIFSPERRSELESHVTAAGTVIVGWGTKSYIGKAAAEAYAVLSELGTVNGLPHENYPFYYHPFPWIQEKCIKWLDDMEVQLTEPAELV